mmetsp:Transcript_23054/g.27861  ORF Transcript_23054/g.27861 Transcript_23054/m.27861 type:complete len:98 (-) Transcript_23054:311-604(-)
MASSARGSESCGEGLSGKGCSRVAGLASVPGDLCPDLATLDGFCRRTLTFDPTSENASSAHTALKNERARNSLVRDMEVAPSVDFDLKRFIVLRFNA